MRTISVSATLPEHDKEDSVFEDTDSEFEFQLQVKPSVKQTNNNVVDGRVMEVVAVPWKEAEVNIMSLLGNLPASLTLGTCA